MTADPAPAGQVAERLTEAQIAELLALLAEWDAAEPGAEALEVWNRIELPMVSYVPALLAEVRSSRAAPQADVAGLVKAARRLTEDVWAEVGYGSIELLGLLAATCEAQQQRIVHLDSNVSSLSFAHTVEQERVRSLEQRIHGLRDVLEGYACPGLGVCSMERLDDGTCLEAATTGACGHEARAALADDAVLDTSLVAGGDQETRHPSTTGGERS